MFVPLGTFWLLLIFYVFPWQRRLHRTYNIINQIPKRAGGSTQIRLIYSRPQTQRFLSSLHRHYLLKLRLILLQRRSAVSLSLKWTFSISYRAPACAGRRAWWGFVLNTTFRSSDFRGLAQTFGYCRINRCAFLERKQSSRPPPTPNPVVASVQPRRIKRSRKCLCSNVIRAEVSEEEFFKPVERADRTFDSSDGRCAAREYHTAGFLVLPSRNAAINDSVARVSKALTVQITYRASAVILKQMAVARVSRRSRVLMSERSISVVSARQCHRFDAGHRVPANSAT